METHGHASRKFRQEGVTLTDCSRTFIVTFPEQQEPPRNIWYTLDEALDLLASLEDSRDVLIDTGHLLVVVDLEHQIRRLNRRLDFNEPEEDLDED